MSQVTDIFYHIMLYRVHLTWVGFKLITLVMIGTDCICNCKSNYHTTTTTPCIILIYCYIPRKKVVGRYTGFSMKFYQQLTGEERRIPFIFDDFHFCRSRVIGLDMTENRIFTLYRMITWVVFLRMFWNFISSLPGFLSFLVGTISNVLVMEIGWTDAGGIS